MKRIKNCDEKMVTYFGCPLIAPAWTRYIAADKSGGVFCYNAEPYRSMDAWMQLPETQYTPCSIEYLGQFDLEGLDWHISLQKV